MQDQEKEEMQLQDLTFTDDTKQEERALEKPRSPSSNTLKGMNILATVTPCKTMLER